MILKIKIIIVMYEIDILEVFWNKNSSKFVLFDNKIVFKNVKCKKEKSIRVWCFCYIEVIVRICGIMNLGWVIGCFDVLF